jgi:hypothetical protein
VGQQFRHQVSGWFQEMFEIVEHQQQVLVLQKGLETDQRRPAGAIGDAQGVGEGRDDQFGLTYRRQGNEGDSIGDLIANLLAGSQRETGLADAARPGDGQEAKIRAAEQIGHDREFPFTADERCQGYR